MSKVERFREIMKEARELIDEEFDTKDLTFIIGVLEHGENGEHSCSIRLSAVNDHHMLDLLTNILRGWHKSNH